MEEINYAKRHQATAQASGMRHTETGRDSETLTKNMKASIHEKKTFAT